MRGTPEPHFTKAFGATVTAPRPRAFGLPRFLVGSTPLFADCIDRNECVLAVVESQTNNKNSH